jgi:hypothetical protein
MGALAVIAAAILLVVIGVSLAYVRKGRPLIKRARDLAEVSTYFDYLRADVLTLCPEHLPAHLCARMKAVLEIERAHLQWSSVFELERLLVESLPY